MGRDARECRHAHHKRYYAKTAFKYEPREWTVAEDKLVLAHDIPDSELSPIIGRSMRAISNRRWRLKRTVDSKGKESQHGSQDRCEVRRKAR